jgi:3' terminal RNA ribose 2'-O-methyltransferase Hen1
MTSWLHEQRMEAVVAEVLASGASSILDFGCGDGVMLTRLAREPSIERLFGVDLCAESLEAFRRRHCEMQAAERNKITVVQGSMTQWNEAYAGFDAAILVETIEHVDPARLSALEITVFARSRPATVIVTTPNAEFNVLLGVPPHRFRHPDHRFEWGRAKFRAWAEGVAARNNYAVRVRDVAGTHPVYGGASQMAVFSRIAGAHVP